MAKNKKITLVDKNTGKRMKIGGLIPSQAKPSKAKRYAASSFSREELPAKVDLRQYMTKVEDQSAANSCTANALVGAYEYLARRTLGDAGDISRLFVYYNARKIDGIKGDKGSSIVSGIQVLEDLGACTEETWPYDTVNIDEEPSEEAFLEAENFLIEEADEVDVDLHTMKHCLAEGYPFTFGLRLFKSFDKARSRGRVPLPDLSTEEGRESHGNHAMLCVGYSEQNQVFIVRNSWGEDWGEEGYCYIPYAYMTHPELCFDCWSIRQVSDLDFTPDVWFDEEYDEEFDWDEEEDDDEYEYEYEYEDDDEYDEDDEEFDDEDEDYEEDDEEDYEENDEEYDDDEEDYDEDEEYEEDDEEDYDDDDKEYDEEEEYDDGDEEE